jgi:small-conductance mechanosensitive channel
MLQQILDLATHERAVQLLQAGVLVLAGLLLARAAAALPARLMGHRLHQHQIMLLRRTIFYGILGIFLATALHQLGFKITVLIGALGIFSIALGFASQTSASNLISGLFLLGERSFSIGDLIKVNNTIGEVLSVDLLSVKLRTFDNLFVRIPNETLIKSEVTTLTRFPIRRYDMLLSVAYHEDIARVREVLMRTADANPLALDEPEPLFIFTGFGDSAMNIQFSVWALRENFLEMRNTLFTDVKQAFDDAGIEIPFPHRSLYAGSQSAPIPVRLVPDNAPARPDGEPPDEPRT